MDHLKSHSRAQSIKEKAAELRFDACGIASVTSIDPDDRFGDWLRNGYHADMAWLERTQQIRQDARLQLPNLRSVIVAARNYHQPLPPRSPGAGRVARYAWGRDYHKVLLKPLRQLAAFIETEYPGTTTYAEVDTGPVLERAWAARAGIGWIGKNSLVIRQGLGSWFVVGTLLTTLELTPDGPVPNYCGHCHACMDACPTAAIVAPGVVDSRRCIAYHTIENRNGIPEEVQQNMGSWVFGCDCCQEVCPWNQNVPESSELEFQARDGVAAPSLEELRGLDEAAFLQRFQGTALMRAKCAGIRRNAEIALDNEVAD